MLGKVRLGLRTVALLVGVCAGALGTLVVAFPPSDGTVSQQTLRRADDLYTADEPLKAEELYRFALPGLAGADRRHCMDRLLTIYVRANRHDLAIPLGLRYERWMREIEERDRARELALALGDWYLALGHAGVAEKALTRGLAEKGIEPLPPARQAAALTSYALALERQGERKLAIRARRKAVEFAAAQLDRPGRVEQPQQRIAMARGLAENCRSLKEPKRAVACLEQLLSLHDRLKEPVEKRETLRLLASHLAADNRLKEAEKRLNQALALHKQYEAGDRLAHGDLIVELLEVLKRCPDREADVSRRFQEAVADYQAVWEGDRKSRQRGRALRAFWKLQELHQRNEQFQQALELLMPLLAEGTGESLIGPRLKSERGGLHVVMGKFADALPLLRAAAAELESQTPPNLIELPRVLVNLGVAELSSGDGAGEAVKTATKLGKRCLGLYQDHRLPEDAVLVDTYNLLGTCAAQDGDYAAAFRHYRDGLERCENLEAAVASPQRTTLLLNQALLHKAEGNLDEALDECQKAKIAYEKFAKPNSLGLAYFQTAEASMLIAAVKPNDAARRKQFEEAAKLSGSALKLCAGKVPDGPLVVTALHCRALYQLSRREHAKAHKTWEDVRKLQKPGSPLLPRTLNHLALTRECQGRFAEAKGRPKEADRWFAEAKKLYEEAHQLQKDNPRAFPVTHFTTLWRLGTILDRQKDTATARDLVEQAVSVADAARVRTTGGPEQRAKFFAQFVPAFELLIDWSVRDAKNGDAKEAVIAAARGRSRTLLDQLELAGVDPLDGLSGAEGEKLRAEVLEHRRRLDGLRARALLVAQGKEDAELTNAQKRYDEIYRKVLNDSVVYRNLPQRPFSEDVLKKLRKDLGPKRLLLVYHIGREKSYLLLVGADSSPVAAFPLMVPAVVANRIGQPPRLETQEVLVRGSRGVTLEERKVVQPNLPAPKADPGKMVPLKEAVLRDLVDNYLAQIRDEYFSPSRGVTLWHRDPNRQVPDQRPELLADVLLPTSARQSILEKEFESLVVVPDGALHRLPFEALVLESGKAPAYVLDKFPPLTYAPSVAILALLGERKASKPGPLTLLTVANPAYPEGKSAIPVGDRPGGDRPVTVKPVAPSPPGKTKVVLRLPRLRYTAEESAAILKLFRDKEGSNPIALEGPTATKQAVVAAIPGRRIVHIAAHGLADSSFGNRFGALALTPVAAKGGAPGDDGFLALHEIYRLNLSKCELAVLSACETNVGPQQPLEAGVTLASAFLAAGSRRVVASHWRADDEATARLMAAFFEELLAGGGAPRPGGYAQALKKARTTVKAKHPSPYFWAPFVLIGPAD